MVHSMRPAGSLRWMPVAASVQVTVFLLLKIMPGRAAPPPMATPALTAASAACTPATPHMLKRKKQRLQMLAEATIIIRAGEGLSFAVAWPLQHIWRLELTRSPDRPRRPTAAPVLVFRCTSLDPGNKRGPVQPLNQAAVPSPRTDQPFVD